MDLGAGGVGVGVGAQMNCQRTLCQGGGMREGTPTNLLPCEASEAQFKLNHVP